MKEKEQQEMLGLAESLFKLVQSYRTPHRFEHIFHFCLRFWRLSPFNVLLVEAQCPNAQYVFTARQWERDYGRRVKSTAKPIVYLDFSPVGFLYEVGDTEEIPGTDRRKYHDYLQEESNPYKEDIPFNIKWMFRLREGMLKTGIDFYTNMEGSAAYAGRIELLDEPITLSIPINRKDGITYDKVYHRMAINRKIAIDAKATFLTVIHELAHYFLGHLPAPDGWKGDYKYRNRLNQKEQEFEAETVVYIVCGRLGFKEYSSVKYLGEYLGEDNLIPNFSFDVVSKAVVEIEKMLYGKFSVKDGFLYKYDKEFASLYKWVQKADKE